MTEVVYDAAVLIACDRHDRRTWAEHRVGLEMGIVPFVPAAVVAQVSRSSRQVGLRLFLRGCRVVSFDERGAHEAGRLLGKAQMTDAVDASVVALALERSAHVLTGDAQDIERLGQAAGAQLVIVEVSQAAPA